jgi:hypothetical protein
MFIAILEKILLTTEHAIPVGAYNFCGGQPMYSVMNGAQTDIDKLLMMHKNCGFYSEILDMYAPAIVSAKVWNNKANMKAYCGTDDPKEFGKHVLTVSDEAFLLIVLINYSAHWYSEIQKKTKDVRLGS